MNIKILTYFFLALAFSNFSYANSQEEKIISLPLPPGVEKKINEHAQGGLIKRLKKEQIILLEKGDKMREIYLAKILKLNGKNIWITVDETGELINIEDASNDEVLEDLVNKKNTKS